MLDFKLTARLIAEVYAVQDIALTHQDIEGVVEHFGAILLHDRRVKFGEIMRFEDTLRSELTLQLEARQPEPPVPSMRAPITSHPEQESWVDPKTGEFHTP